ncbi:MAG: methylmalonyl Co-A mutase-associated GTPase MeaB [Actinobacteria bacterium]|nr:MAG: methylmalonyl Co-A mutase-associated GTPase MeaB [Actinomycetota bacterium]
MPEAARSAEASLAERVVAGDKRALARAISLVENRDPEGDRLVAELFPRTGKARVVGMTGPPGVGKSTLIGALTKELREAGRAVGVLSIDPSSPFTQGAMLGDRIRLAEHFLDTDVFIRSMATRGSLGGMAEAALQAALLMDASGKDDVLLLALMPGSGDSIQALKAGVMEIPDVIVVNKSDHPLADTMVREVRSALGLGPQGPWKVPVVKTEAAKGDGIEQLLRRIDAHRKHIEDTGTLAERRARNLRAEVLGIAAARLRRRLEERAQVDPGWEDLLDSVTRRETDPATAARKLLAMIDDEG